MEQKLQLKDLYLGNIDAKNELLNNSDTEIERFEKSFLMPSNIILDDFLNSNRYFILGLKGTGKTALLRYLALRANEISETYSTFILFKSDFTEEDRKSFARAANINAKIVDASEIPFEQDFVDAWLWFFHRHIVKTIVEQNLTVFKQNKIWNQYKACVLAPNLDENGSIFSKFVPKLKRGTIEVGMQFPIISGKLGLDFEFANPEKTKVKFNYIVDKANELFNKLTAETGRLYILLDELELSLVKRKYDRDAKMIRDVIIAIEKLNNISKKNKFGLYIIGAIRSEVLTAVNSFGKEINKQTSDFGISIIWHQSGGDISTHPILKIIAKRIESSEYFYDLPKHELDEIWNKYFPKYIQNTQIQTYILNQTWYRPRDVIRLITVAQKYFPNKTDFDQQVFDTIRKQYSTDSWIELSEELKTSFEYEEIEGIKRLFYGFKPNFSLDELKNHVELICKFYPEVNNLLAKYTLESILSKLYKIGFIGNVIKGKMRSYYRFSYRGDDEILIEKDFTVHRGLRPYFSI